MRQRYSTNLYDAKQKCMRLMHSSTVQLSAPLSKPTKMAGSRRGAHLDILADGVLLKIKPSNGQIRTTAGSSADADACTDIKTTVDGHLLAVVQNELLHFDEDGNHFHVVSSRSMQQRPRLQHSSGVAVTWGYVTSLRFCIYPLLIENFTWKYTSFDREAILVRPPSMTLRSHSQGGLLSQAEISLHSVYENLADRPTRPDKSRQEMHNPTGFPLASTDPPRVYNGAVGVSATPPPQGYTASTSVFTI